jgi:hypothetical protein
MTDTITINKEIKGKKIEFVIEFLKISIDNTPFAEFKIKWGDKEDIFDTKDLHTYKGYEVISFSEYSEIGKELGNGKSIKFVIGEEVKNKLLEIEREEIEKYKNKLLGGEFEIIHYQEISTYDTLMPLNRWSLGSDEVGQVVKNELEENGIHPVEFWNRIKDRVTERDRGAYGFIVKDKVFKTTKEEFYKIIYKIKNEKKQKEEEERKKYEEAMKNEIDVLDEDQIYSKRNLQFEHSLAVRYSQKNNKVKVAGKTYDIKEELKSAGFRWDGNEKCWYTDYSEDNLQKAVDIVKKYDQKRDYEAEGYVQCWECGRWWKPKHYYIGMDTYCGC